MDEDCYFWIDESVLEEERVMSVMCVSCHEAKPSSGWFWEGSVKGYGNYEYKCAVCGKVIHSAPENIEK